MIKVHTVFVALLLASFVRPCPVQAGVDRVVMRVDGVSCSLCTVPLMKKLRALPGVLHFSFDLPTGVATFEARAGGSLSLNRARTLIREAGFTPGIATITATGHLVRQPDGVWLLAVDGTDTQFQLIDVASPALRQTLEETAGREEAVRVVGNVGPAPADNPKGRPARLAVTRVERLGQPHTTESPDHPKRPPGVEQERP